MVVNSRVLTNSFFAPSKIPQKEVPQNPPISVVSYNLFHIYSKIVDFSVPMLSRSERVEKQAADLLKLSPTFILVQEAFHKESREKIIEALSSTYGVVNNDSYNIKNGVFKFSSGLLIFYKKDQLTHEKDKDTFELFQNGYLLEKFAGQKGFLTSFFRSKKGDLIQVTNTHLSSLDPDGKVTTKQAKTIKDALDEKKALYKPDLEIIGGDFNSRFTYESELDKEPPTNMLCKGPHPFESPDYISEKVFTWNGRNPLVKLSNLWPEEKNPLCHDMILTRSKEGLFQQGKPSLVMEESYDLPSLSGLKEKFSQKRKPAIAFLKTIEDKILLSITKHRKVEGGRIYWSRGVERLDPDGRIRKAIDSVFHFSKLEGRNPKDVKQASFEQGFPLSDHYGLRLEVRKQVSVEESGARRPWFHKPAAISGVLWGVIVVCIKKFLFAAR